MGNTEACLFLSCDICRFLWLGLTWFHSCVLLLRTYLGLTSVLLHDLVCNFAITSFDLALSLNMEKYLMISNPRMPSRQRMSFHPRQDKATTEPRAEAQGWANARTCAGIVRKLPGPGS